MRRHVRLCLVGLTVLASACGDWANGDTEDDFSSDDDDSSVIGSPGWRGNDDASVTGTSTPTGDTAG